MKKLSYILVILGLSLICISLTLLNNRKEEKNNWTVGYQKGNVGNSETNYFENSENKIITIKTTENGQKLFYLVPNNTYLDILNSELVEYKNDVVTIMQYTKVVQNAQLDDYYESLKDNENITDVIISESNIINDNKLFLEKGIYKGSYYENLYLFLKSNNGYYQILYRLKNMSFSDNFINEIINLDNYKYDNLNNPIIDGKIELNLDTESKLKTFTLNYDSSKYSLLNDEITTDYEKKLFSNKYNFYIKLSIYYNSDIYIPNDEKINIKEFNGIKYSNFTSDGIEIYIIYIDDNTKLKISYDSRSKSFFDISDFMNFTFD